MSKSRPADEDVRRIQAAVAAAIPALRESFRLIKKAIEPLRRAQGFTGETDDTRTEIRRRYGLTAQQSPWPDRRTRR